MMEFLFGNITAEEFFNILLIFGLGPVVCYYAFRFGFGLCQNSKAKELNACTTCPPPDDAIESKRNLERYIYRAAEEQGIDTDQPFFKEMMNISDKVIIQTFRLAHALGCEFVFRKVCNKDIEDKPVLRSGIVEHLLNELKETDGYLGEYEI